jgi:hypothetical protein
MLGIASAIDILLEKEMSPISHEDLLDPQSPRAPSIRYFQPGLAATGTSQLYQGCDQISSHPFQEINSLLTPERLKPSFEATRETQIR